MREGLLTRTAEAPAASPPARNTAGVLRLPDSLLRVCRPSTSLRTCKFALPILSTRNTSGLSGTSRTASWTSRPTRSRTSRRNWLGSHRARRRRGRGHYRNGLRRDPSDEHGFVFGLYVIPSSRGRGVATALMVAGATQLERQRRRYIVLTVDPPNASARVMYEQFGFVDQARVLRTEVRHLLDRNAGAAEGIRRV